MASPIRRRTTPQRHRNTENCEFLFDDYGKSSSNALRDVPLNSPSSLCFCVSVAWFGGGFQSKILERHLERCPRERNSSRFARRNHSARLIDPCGHRGNVAADEPTANCVCVSG